MDAASSTPSNARHFGIYHQQKKQKTIQDNQQQQLEVYAREVAKAILTERQIDWQVGKLSEDAVTVHQNFRGHHDFERVITILRKDLAVSYDAFLSRFPTKRWGSRGNLALPIQDICGPTSAQVLEQI